MSVTVFKLKHKGGFMQENTYQCCNCEEMFYEQSIEKWKYCPICASKIIKKETEVEKQP